MIASLKLCRVWDWAGAGSVAAFVVRIWHSHRAGSVAACQILFHVRHRVGRRRPATNTEEEDAGQGRAAVEVPAETMELSLPSRTN